MEIQANIHTAQSKGYSREMTDGEYLEELRRYKWRLSIVPGALPGELFCKLSAKYIPPVGMHTVSLAYPVGEAGVRVFYFGDPYTNYTTPEIMAEFIKKYELYVIRTALADLTKMVDGCDLLRITIRETNRNAQRTKWRKQWNRE